MDRTLRPLVGITTDLEVHPNGRRVFAYAPYARAVALAGGVPLLLPPEERLAAEYALRLDAFVFTGGDDPRTESFGAPTHPKAVPVAAERQEFETRLLHALAECRPDTPVLGVCLGMQMMALVAGGRLDQYLPETLATHSLHWESEHPVVAVGAASGLHGTVRSKHRQGVASPGRLRVCAAAPDGLVEAVDDPGRRFYLGVQWHPERTGDAPVGQEIFDALVAATRRASGSQQVP